MPATPVRTISVDVLTHRGTTIHRTVALAPLTMGFVNDVARARCGYQEPLESFGWEPEGARRIGRTVVLTAWVTNRSVLPLQLASLQVPPGITLTTMPELPLALPPQPRPIDPTGTQQPLRTRLQLRLTVHECRALASVLIRTDGTVAIEQPLNGRIARGPATAEPMLFIDVPDDSARPVATSLLLGLC